MSSIDKTYVNKTEYIQARNFWLETKEQQIKELGFCQWLYTFDVFKVKNAKDVTIDHFQSEKDIITYFLDDNTEYPLWNTSCIFDMWLAKNCKLSFIQNRLKEQYGEDWFVFKYKDEIMFEEKPWIISIENSKSLVYFFRKIDDNIVETIDKVIVYGTTYFIKIFNEAIESLEQIIKNNDLIVTFEFYGLHLKKEKDKFYIISNNEEIKFPYIYNLRSYFDLPTIKHSYKLSDSKKYKDDEIFLSYDKECCDITQYKNFDRKYLRRYVHFLPEYIREYIK